MATQASMRLSTAVANSTGADAVNSPDPTEAVAVEMRSVASGSSIVNRHRSCAPEFSCRGRASP